MASEPVGPSSAFDLSTDPKERCRLLLERAQHSATLRLSFLRGLELPAPEVWLSLKHLTSLSLHGNGLSDGEALGCLACLCSLTSLDLSQNALCGVLPPFVESLSQLQHLDVGSNRLEALGNAVRNLTRLTVLSASFNQITRVPFELTRLSRLKRLDLSSNSLVVWPALPEGGVLRRLLLSRNRIKRLDSAASVVALQMKSLRVLDLSHNDLTAVPPELFEVTSLQSLNVCANPLEVCPNPPAAFLARCTYSDSVPSTIPEIPGLFLGDLAAALNPVLLRHMGITAVVSCLQVADEPDIAKEHRVLWSSASHSSSIRTLWEPSCQAGTAGLFRYLALDVKDAPDCNILSHFPVVCAFLDRHLPAVESKSCGPPDKGVLCHCARGVSRSAAVVIAYAMHRLKVSARRAMTLVAKHRPVINPNSGFISQLKQWELQLQLRDDHTDAHDVVDSGSRLASAAKQAAVDHAAFLRRPEWADMSQHKHESDSEESTEVDTDSDTSDDR